LSEKGEELAAALAARAPDLCDAALTAALEEALDAVEAGDPPWPEALRAVFARTHMAAGRQVGKQRPLPPDLGGILAGFDRSVP
jgi:DNA topoisomerase IA